MAFDFKFIMGMSLGFEFLPDDGSDKDISWVFVVDLLILRLALIGIK